jgi:hypothetical protein
MGTNLGPDWIFPGYDKLPQLGLAGSQPMPFYFVETFKLTMLLLLSTS